MKIGYARVSTNDQKLELQMDALEKYGCEKIYKEKTSAVKERAELEELIRQLRKGDTVVVWRLDRLGRSLNDMINLVEKFKKMDVGFVSIMDHIDTKSAQGRFFFNILATLAEYEREMARERIQAGLMAARERGRIGGRPKGLSEASKKKAESAKALYDKDIPVKDIIKALNISKATLYRYLKY